MSGIVSKLLNKVFGNKSEKDINKLLPIVYATNEEFSKLTSISNDELRNKTKELQQQLKDAVKETEQQIAQLKDKAENTPLDQLDEKEAIYNQIDALDQKITDTIEEVLNEIAPKAFAIVKETARRFSQNPEIEVSANDMDKNMAATRDHIEIRGEKAFYKNHWIAGGSGISWDMVHYDVQLIGGAVIHQGKIAEMGTGEGKTLVATLPVFLNALPKKGVHVVTVNDYLAKRDSEWMGPLFEFHGLTIDCIDKHTPNSVARRKAYMADITYGTNNEFGFDYLRDNMCNRPEELVQRKHNFAIVDEVDSVLIDDARTPLIISGPTPRGNKHEFKELKPMVEKLVAAQRKLVTTILADAKKYLNAEETGGKVQKENEEKGGLALLRAHRGLPKNKALIKFLSESGIKTQLQKTENFYLQDQAKEMPKVDEELFFTIDEKHNSIELTEKGIDLISGDTKDHNFFILPDIASEITEIEKSTLSDTEKLNRKDKLMLEYGVKADRIHTMNQLLKAYTLFEMDVEYVLMDGKIKIVDEQTGRIMEGRRYSDGLHQAIEAKENVKIEAATQTYATITLQNYFRMYNKLSGMTGTAETEAQELWDIYKTEVVIIPTNKPIAREDRDDLVYKTNREKYTAVIDEIVALVKAERPVLVGTTSVEISELLSRMLKMKGIKHNVLNAKLHQKEADIVAEAGKAGTVTIATNMAGRGTDIKVNDKVKTAGGLAIIGTERHESRRVDRQLRGRSGRQGDPGSSQFFVSLEDNLMRLFGSDRIARLMDRMGLQEGEVIQHSMISKSIERAQKKVEENNFGIRKNLLEYDDIMNQQREVIYKKRKHALFGERLQVDIANMFYDVAEEVAHEAHDVKDYENFKLELIRILSIESPVSEEDFLKVDPKELTHLIYEKAVEHYKRKSELMAQTAFPVVKNVFDTQGENIKNIVVPFTDGIKTLNVSAPLHEAVESAGKAIITAFEKGVILAIIDDSWKDHLREMDDLKQSVQNARFEQKDPLLIYKFEAFNLFKSFVANVNKEVVTFLVKGVLPSGDATNIAMAKEPKSTLSNIQTSKSSTSQHSGVGVSQNGGQAPSPPPKVQPVRVDKKVGRNDVCPCGSGKKFKQCHGKNIQE